MVPALNIAWVLAVVFVMALVAGWLLSLLDSRSSSTRKHDARVHEIGHRQHRRAA
jgi:hypothetical protein